MVQNGKCFSVKTTCRNMFRITMQKEPYLAIRKSLIEYHMRNINVINLTFYGLTHFSEIVEEEIM